MGDRFPTLHRGRRATRLGAIAMVVVALLLAGRTTRTSLEWIGRPFPGFMVLDNRVVASINLAHWSGAGVSNLFQSQVLAVDGRPVASAAALYAEVASRPVGTPVTYRLRRGGRESEAVVPTQRFGVTDWLLLFGVFLLNGITYVAAAAVVWVLSPRPLGRAFVVAALSWALFLLTAMDLYGPATFFRLHVAAETLVPATMFQLALLFPEPHRLARWRFAGYVPALVVLVLYEIFLYEPRVYSMLMQLNMALLGAACFV